MVEVGARLGDSVGSTTATATEVVGDVLRRFDGEPGILTALTWQFDDCLDIWDDSIIVVIRGKACHFTRHAQNPNREQR